MTQREFILSELRKTKEGLSTTQLAEIAIEYGYLDRYTRKAGITASFSSILRKLRKKGVVKLSKKKAIRGGMIHQLK